MSFTTTLEGYEIPFKILIGKDVTDADCFCDVEINSDLEIESVGNIIFKDAKDERVLDSDDALFFHVRDGISNFLCDDHAFKIRCKEVLRSC